MQQLVLIKYKEVYEVNPLLGRVILLIRDANEVEGGRVDAEALAGGSGAVAKNVSEMRVALGAADLGAYYSWIGDEKQQIGTNC